MTLYASVEFTKSIMGPQQVVGTNTNILDAKVQQLLRTVSARVDRAFHERRPLFAPYIETRKFPLDGRRVNSASGTFEIDGYLLSLTGTGISGTTVSNVEGYPDSSMPPFSYLHLTGCCDDWYTTVCSDCSGGSGPQMVSVTGIWGMHTDYAHAWLAVDALAAAITTTTATTFTVASAAGDDAYGQPYRISIGHLLKIDDEYMEVVKVVTNTITVIRGANGSTAATHLIAAVVYRWEVIPEVQYAVARQAGLLYSRLGAYQTVDVSPVGSEVRYPSDWLAEVMGVMQGFVYGI